MSSHRGADQLGPGLGIGNGEGLGLGGRAKGTKPTERRTGPGVSVCFFPCQ